MLSIVQHALNNTSGKLELLKPNSFDRVRGYRQHIRQPEYQKLKVEKHLRTCGKCTFEVFPLLHVRSSEFDLRRSFKKNFMKKYKTKLNYL